MITFFKLMPTYFAVPMALLAPGACWTSSFFSAHRNICSMRLVPEHCIVTSFSIRVNFDSFIRCSSLYDLGLTTRPLAPSLQLSLPMIGMPPWLRTKWSDCDVTDGLRRNKPFGRLCVTGKLHRCNISECFSRRTMSHESSGTGAISPPMA